MTVTTAGADDAGDDGDGDGSRRVVVAMLGADGACALPFALAVVRQLDGEPRRGADAAVGERIAPLLDAAARGGAAIEAAAATLVLDAELLAATYSNLDLLPRDCAAGDRVAAALSRALELLARAGG